MTTDNAESRRSLPRPIPERIKEAREARGLSLEALAESVGVTKQAVAQYETGQTSPSAEVMSKIIAETGQSLQFFIMAPVRPGEPGTPFWRSLKRMEHHHRRRILRRLQWANDICSLVSEYIVLPTVNLPKLEFDPDNATEDDVEAAAEAVRDLWGLGRGPIRHLATTLEEHGVVIVRERVDCPDMDAVSCWFGGRPFVLLSDEVTSGPRDAFNLAHELGHIILHAGIEVSTDNLDLIEKQAHRFAGAFLLPRAQFSSEVLGTSLAYFKSLKERWGVAIAAMAYRCRDLEIFSENQFSYLFRQMNYHRIRKSEPLDDAFPVNVPSILGDSVRMLIDHGVLTRAQIEQKLGLNMRDVESLVGVPAGYLDTKVVRMQFKPQFREHGA